MNPVVVLAALLHDVGKLAMAERTRAHFSRALAQAEEEGVPLFAVEEKLIHISHAEVGAYLLSLWGLPYTVVEAVAHHHHPRRMPQSRVDMPLVVYLSNLLAHERGATAKGLQLPEIVELLEQTGVAGKLSERRKIAELADTEQVHLVG
jgi:putative nucleotidyltransferase with HDIG domain